MQRNIIIDTLRGLLLVWMTFNHLGGPVSVVTLQALGFISSIEGFVFISGIVAGMVYGRIGLKQGNLLLRKRAFRRALDIYLFHMASFVFIMILELSISNERFTSFYLQSNPVLIKAPITALELGVIFLLQPPFLDILPMYCLFLLITPFCINSIKNNHGYWVLLGSFLVWSLVNYHYECWNDLEKFLRQYNPCILGVFNPLAWQFLFIGGLFIGFRSTAGIRIPIKKSLIIASLLIWLFIMLVRYEIIPSNLFGFELINLTLRETFGPLRVINLLTLAYLIVCFATLFPKFLKWPWFSYLGQHSLQVFTFHLVLIYVISPLYDLIIPFGWTVILLTNIAIASTLTIPAWLHVKYRALIKYKGSLPDI
jgi:hypothetical protein